MLLMSLKDEPKPNPAVNSSPSSWGKTWITMTLQSSTARSMEKTSSSVWRISGRPGKHLKVKKRARSQETLSQECQRVWISDALGRACSSQEEYAAFPALYQSLCCSGSLLQVWVSRISSGLVLPSCQCCTWAWPPKYQWLFCSSALGMCVQQSQMLPSSGFSFKHPVSDGILMGW